MRQFLALLLACVFALPTISHAKKVGNKSHFNRTKHSTMALLSGYMSCSIDMVETDKFDPTFSQLACECLTDAMREGKETANSSIYCSQYADKRRDLKKPEPNAFNRKKWPTHALFTYSTSIYNDKRVKYKSVPAWQYSTCEADLLREKIDYSEFVRLGKKKKLSKFFRRFKRSRSLRRCRRYLR